MKFLSDIEVEEGLRDKDGGLGSPGQILSSTGSLTSWIDATSGSIGGSIADNQIAVGASTANNIEGASDFTYIDGRISLGDSNGIPSMYIGVGAGTNATTGNANVAVGRNSMASVTTAYSNSAFGTNSLSSASGTGVNQNTAIGQNTLGNMVTGIYNVALGDQAAYYRGSASLGLTISNRSVYVGADTRPAGNDETNQIVIGYEAVGGGSNTITLGDGDIDTLRIPGLGNTNGYVLTYSTADDGFILAAGGGGGGGIGGTTTATEIAFGSATASTLDSDPGLTYTSGGGLSVGSTTGSGNSVITMDKGDAGQARIMMKNTAGGVTAEKFSIKLDGSEDTYITAVNTLTISTGSTTKDIILNPSGNVGVGDTSPSSKLSVLGGIQMANDGDAAAQAKAGTLKYYNDSGASYLQICMQTGSTGLNDYEWVTIVKYDW